MGFLWQPARLDGTDVRPEVLFPEAARHSRELEAEGFLRDLDRDRTLPGPTRAERVVVLGIGGSALGARVVHDACRRPGTLPMIVADNVDPEALEAAWGAGDPARAAWVVVSKSGTTTETLAQWAIAKERFARLDARPEIHVVTGERGPLREEARASGLFLHDVPEDVGGRFSVFTPAATVPLALAGYDVPSLLEGARAGRADALEGRAAAHLAALLTAAWDAGRSVVALWAYAERLESVGEWFRQLWAESLGKTRPDGVPVGQTPLHCVGSTDQHSIQQLMVEGPKDKAVLVLAGPRAPSARVPEASPGAGAGHELDAVLHAMRRATTAQMARAGAPAATLVLEDWSERSLGALLVSFLCATVVAGRLMGVDPYGQPGVEAAKKATRRLLGEPGGEFDREIASLLGEDRAVRCG